MSIKIYITNLGKYNEGCLIGQWVKLPVSKDKLKDVLDEIGINDEFGQSGGEFDLLNYYGLDEFGIYSKVRVFVREILELEV